MLQTILSQKDFEFLERKGPGYSKSLYHRARKAFEHVDFLLRLGSFGNDLNISPRIMEWSVQPGVGCRLPIGYSFPDKNRERRQERLSPKRKIPFSIM